MACQCGQQGMVAFLVGRGAKLDIEDHNGDTCLHWAAYKGFPDLTRLLIGNFRISNIFVIFEINSANTF